MALSPLPPDNTLRYWLNYSVAGIDHALQSRVDPAGSDAGAIATFNGLLDELDPILATNAVFSGVDKAVAGSNVRNPVAGWTARSGAGGFSSTGDARAFQTSFVGRSVDGRKVKWQFWGLGPTSDGDFRWEAGDIAYLDDAIAYMASQSRYFLTISGLKPVMHLYTNYGYNDHTVRQLR